MELKFKKTKLSDLTYEACSVFDVDNDGVMDIVCGAYWYKGPDFKENFKIWEPAPAGEYFDDFSSYPIDVNGNGHMDIITGGWWGETLKWLENPGDSGEWHVHEIEHTGNIETTRFYDIDGCGTVEIFPNTPGKPQRIFKLIKDANGKGTGEFKSYTISEGASGHGMGFGDINGDGKIEIILTKGYLKQCGDMFSMWEFVPADFGTYMGSVPMLVYDVNGDGRMDVIKGSAHGYGLFWYEQNADGSFTEHVIDDKIAQAHDMVMVDIDGDGELELFTGRRYRAHCGGDPGDNDDPGIYYYKLKDGSFEKHIIEQGSPETSAGLGIYFWLHDLSGNGYLDIVAPGKTGLYLFENMGRG